MRWQSARDDAGQVFVVDDPLAAVTAAALADARDPAAQVAALIGIGAIFPPALATDKGLRDTLTRHLAALSARGALDHLTGRAAGERLAAKEPSAP